VGPAHGILRCLSRKTMRPAKFRTCTRGPCPYGDLFSRRASAGRVDRKLNYQPRHGRTPDPVEACWESIRCNFGRLWSSPVSDPSRQAPRRSRGVDNAVGVGHSRHRQRRAHPITPRPLIPSVATARSGPLRLSTQPVHGAWRRAAVTACAFAGLHPDESAVASWRCSCDRLGVAHSALSRTRGVQLLGSVLRSEV
jgi:hypothetical protein